MIACNNALSRNQSWLWAIILSLAVHLGFLLGIGHWRTSGKSLVSLQGEAGAPIAVRLEAMNRSRQEASTSVLAASEGEGKAADSPAATKESGGNPPTSSSGDSAFTAPSAGQARLASHAILPEPVYFPADELTQKPQLLRDIPSDYMRGFPDVFTRPLILRLLINEKGVVDKVVIEEALLSRQGIQILEDAFSKAKFLPGKVGKMAVKSQITIEVSLQNVPAIVSPPVVLKP